MFTSYLKPAKPQRKELEFKTASEASISLAEEAKSVLGYRQYLSHIHAMGRPLGKKLKELDIVPFDPQEVAAYKGRIAGNFDGYDWRFLEIAKYKQPIPEFVLRKAIQVKQAFPQAEFFVDYLCENPDPFLYVKFEEEGYWIEVWDEPKFEATI